MKIKIKGVIVSNDYKEIYDWFGIEAVCPNDIDAQIEAAKGEDLEFEINSPGGDVYAGSEIYTAIKSYEGDTVGKVVGIAASAASVAAMGVKKLLISPTAQIMIHNVWAMETGDYRDMEHAAVVLKGWNKSIANAYMLKTGMSQSELLSFMNKETWLPAQDAIKYKFADEIMFDEGMQLAASFGNTLLPKEVIDKVRKFIKNSQPKPIELENFDAKQLAEAFRKANRSGTPLDNPEGTRYITISDTLATKIANLVDPQPEASRQVPVDLYSLLLNDLERRANLC